MNIKEMIAKIDEIADQECVCDDSYDEVECDNPKVHVARSAINEIGSILRQALREMED